MTGDASAARPLRVRAAMILAVLFVAIRYILPLVYPDGTVFGLLGSVVLAVATIVWWLFFSRAPWSERLGVLAFAIAALIATSFVIHPSIKGGMMGMMLWIYASPDLALAIALGVAIARHSSAATRRAIVAAAIVLACGGWAMLRTDGIMGTGSAQLRWRWTPTAEERLLAAAPMPGNATMPSPVATPTAATASTTPAPVVPATPPSSAAAPVRASDTAAKAATPAPAPALAANDVDRTPVRWSGFRGDNRDGIVRAVRIATDWTATPPVQVWKRPIGPGWSSFSVRGDLLYTQEQRGEEEIVAAYRTSSGEPAWTHRDRVRFYESNGGAGPRGTPTVNGNRVYALGATGILNALDADTGALVWTRNAVSDTGVPVPEWGISASPLVVDDVVIVATSGALAAYDRRSGDKRWVHASNGGSYSSPQLVTLDGVSQVVLMAGKGAISVAPADGTVLWQYAWQGVPIVQPAFVGGRDVVLTTADGMGGAGIRRIGLTHASTQWNVEERWTSTGLKPYYNDYVIHKGFAFGFDGNILSCVDLADGKRQWKGGRYGNGQLVLLPDQDLLLVLSEEGDIALVDAKPDQFTERAHVAGLDGKTWNHPVIVGDMLYVRNGEQMAAFRLPRQDR